MLQHPPGTAPASDPRGIQRRVYALRMQPLEQLRHKLPLAQGLAARHRDPAAVLKIRPVPQGLLYHLLGRYAQGRRGVEGPGVRVVAVDAAQGAALEEDQVPEPRAVHGPHALKGMNHAVHRCFPRLRLHGLVEGAGDNLLLLRLCQLVEVHRVARDPDGQVGIFLRVLVGVHERLPVEDVHVDVVGHLGEVAVEDGHQVGVPALPPSLPSACGHDGEGVGDAVPAVRHRRAWPPS